LWFLRLEF
jgi:putative transposase